MDNSDEDRLMDELEKVKYIQNLDVRLLKAQLFSVMKATDDHSIAKVDRTNLEGLENFLSDIIAAFEEGVVAVCIWRQK